MGLFGSEKLFNIRDSQELLRALSTRKHWNLIRPEVLSALVDNANGDVLKISRFVFVSEYYDCVKNNFVELANIWKDPRLALSSFGATLVGLAGDIIQHLGDMQEGSERQTQATSLAELSFLSAVLCDRYLLTAYKGLASFYSATGRLKLAAAACRQYDEAEQKILQATDDYLRAYRETKYKPIATALRAEVDRLEAELGVARG
jgi:hypothetical protein